jgi:hypothetical protein
MNQIDQMTERIAAKAIRISGRLLSDFAEFEPGLSKGSTEIWYASPESLRDASMGYAWLEKKGMLPDPDNLGSSHVLLGKISESDLNQIYRIMQGENWSPEGEANSFIRSKGLHHTSMSIGDIIVVGGKTSMVDRSGFKKI